MLYRIKTDIKRSWFDRKARRITATSPIATNPNSTLMVVSQLRSSDVYMYLIAIKTLMTQLTEARILVLDDGLYEQDRILLSQHIEGIDFRPVSAIGTGRCPNGSAWERLLAICDECQTKYVIQADADLLAVGSLDLVRRHVRDDRSFVLASSMTPDFVSPAHAASLVAAQVRKGDTHVQPVAEAHFTEIPRHQTLRYIRGCAGFAGFAMQSTNRRVVEDFSVAMEDVIGPKWHEWGSEQVASNYAIANSTNPAALPVQQYLNFQPNADLSNARLIHFMGKHRFDGGVYRELATRQINTLMSE